MPPFTTTAIISSQSSNLSGRGLLRLLEDRSSSRKLYIPLKDLGIPPSSWLSARWRFMREVIFPKESGIEPCNWLADGSRSTKLSLELDNQGTIDEESWLNERSRIARDLEELMKERAEGTMIYKSAGSHPGLTGWTGSWVDPPGRSGFARSIPKRVFASTRTGPRPGSAGSRIDPPGRSGF